MNINPVIFLVFSLLIGAAILDAVLPENEAYTVMHYVCIKYGPVENGVVSCVQWAWLAMPSDVPRPFDISKP